MITQQDYRINGYKKKKTNNLFGDRHIIEYFKTFSIENGFENLMVRETRTHDRNQFGIPETTTVVIEWFGSDKTQPRATKTLVKPLDSDDGLRVNEQSRTRLINDAKSMVISTIGLDPGKQFMRMVSGEINEYKEGDRQPLVDAINSSTLAEQLKLDLVALLDVSYIPQN